MRKLRVISVLVALLLPMLALGASRSLAAAPSSPGANVDNVGAQPAAPGPTVSFPGSYPLSVEAGDYDLTYLVLDFAPGAEIPLHYHGGPALVVGMQGMLTLRPEGAPEHMLMPGDVVNEKAGVRHIMINTSTSNARIMAVVLLPKGAQLTTVVDTNPNPPAGPTVPFHGDFPMTVAAGDYSLENLVLDFAPGAEIPLHYHGGPALVVGMNGTLTLRPEGASEHMLMPGGVVNENAGVRHVMINTSSSDATILAGVLLPKGAALTTLVTQPSQPVGMPQTGAGVAGIIVWLVFLAVLQLALGGLARRSHSRTAKP